MSAISPKQIRAGLALIDWIYADLAKATGITVDTISRICRMKHRPQAEQERKIKAALEMNGVEFTERDGVCSRAKDIEIFDGLDRFREFTELTYSYLEKFGGEVCISVTDEHDLQHANGKLGEHRTRMAELKKTKGVTGRILACEGEFKSAWAEMRKQQITPNVPKVSFYTVGDNFALISFDGDPSPHVVLHKASPFTAAYKVAFDAAWEKAEVLS
jgi:transcriptional regulator with XRE-family HTH domain